MQKQSTKSVWNARFKSGTAARQWFKVPVFTAIGLIILLCITSPAHALPAGWLNYGNGSEGHLSVSGIVYTNDVVYPVATYSTTSGISITIASKEPKYGIGAWDSLGAGTGSFQKFAVGDRIMIVDLSVATGSTARNYDLATITIISYSSGTTTISATGAGTTHVTTGTKTLTQVIKVHQWRYISFGATNDTLTCHEWNASTGIGGIMAFNCDSLLDLSTYGIISTIGKGPQGIAGHARGVVGTQGGSVGTAGTVMEGNATSATGSPLGNPYTANGGILMQGCTSKFYGGNGGCGDGAWDGTGPFPGRRENDFAAPSKTHLLMSFNSGVSGLTGQGGGSGGDAGGGGAGLVVRSGGIGEPTDGFAGMQAVGYGGQGGAGGTGGGLIYMKVYEIKTNHTGRGTAVIFTGGTAGIHGEDGSYTTHGDGGNGGRGGDGGCSAFTTYEAPGGGGGKGQGGNGSDGGGGGNGGPGGDIWIGAYIYTTLVLADMNAGGGAGAPGGSGTIQSNNGLQGNNGASPSVCSMACGTCSGFSYISAYDTALFCHVGAICSGSDAFRILALMRTNTVFGSGYKYTNPVTGDPRSYAVWDPTDTTLTAFEWTPKAGGTCSNLPHDGTVSSFYDHFSCATSLPFWGNIATQGSTGGGIITWAGVGQFNIASNTVTDNNGNSCTGVACGAGVSDPSGCIRPCAGKDGPAGTAGTAGSSTVPSASEPTTSGSDPSGPEETGIKDAVADYHLQLIPNPASENTIIKFMASGNATYTITVMDITGKEVYRRAIAAQTGENSLNINVKDFKAGEYIFNIDSKGVMEHIKFVKE